MPSWFGRLLTESCGLCLTSHHAVVSVLPPRSFQCLRQSVTLSNGSGQKRTRSYKSRNVPYQSRRVKPRLDALPSSSSQFYNSKYELSNLQRRDRISNLRTPLSERALVRYTNENSRPDLRGNNEDGRMPFKTAVQECLTAMEESISYDKIFSTAGVDVGDLQQRFKAFQESLHRILAISTAKPPRITKRLQEAFEARGTKGLELQLKYSFYGYVATENFTASQVNHQKDLTDLRRPGEWFPGSRAIQRKIHLHVGPTNSGKTYQALKRLEETNEPGVYAGPLRLLAHEVYMRLNAAGKPCHLVTGEERRAPVAIPTGNESPKISCTVEMMPLSTVMKVAVIDEIQMIGDSERGWAWTQAFLGVQAEEVHLCGEPRSIPIIQELAASIGDDLEIHKYNRLSPLQMEPHSLNGRIKSLRKGDCIVAFSVMTIHGLRQLIERTHEKKVAIIYGNLPPETRAQQAKLFNDPDNDYDFLVASDAVGMGLNLNIRRMVFHTSYKFYANRYESLSIAEIKQIGGRAGRYSTAEADMKKKQAKPRILDLDADAPIAFTQPDAETDQISQKQGGNIGYITALEQKDFSAIKQAMNSDPLPISSAGLFPPASIVESFARYFPPTTPFSYIIIRLHELCQMHPRFHLCNLKETIEIADTLESIQGLSIQDRIIFCAAPISPRRQGEQELAHSLAEYVANNQAISISDMEILDLELLEETAMTRSILKRLELLHKGVMLYIWLSYRFSGVFITRDLAFYVKTLVEDRIEKTLANLSFDLTRITFLRARATDNEMKQLVDTEESGGHAIATGTSQLSTEGLEHLNSDTRPDPAVRDLPTGRVRPKRMTHSQCSKCLQYFEDRKSLMIHKKYGLRDKNTDTCLKGWVCKYCKEQLPNKDQFVLHVRKEHPKDTRATQPCKYCGTLFFDEDELRLHFRHDHKEMMLSEDFHVSENQQSDFYPSVERTTQQATVAPSS